MHSFTDLEPDGSKGKKRKKKKNEVAGYVTEGEGGEEVAI